MLSISYCIGTELLCSIDVPSIGMPKWPCTRHTYIAPRWHWYTSGTKMANLAKGAFPHEKIKGEKSEEKRGFCLSMLLLGEHGQ